MSLSTSSRFRDRRIHAWYTSVMAFPDHLVASILESFAPCEGDVFFDPYCGSGTSLVEAQLKGLRVFGIDANPTSVLASLVKTNWLVNPVDVRMAIDRLSSEASALENRGDDPIVAYLENSGMIRRGWIARATAIRAAAIKRWIDKSVSGRPVHRFIMLGLIATVVKDLANVKFGPELYCVSAPDELPDVVTCLVARLHTMVAELESHNRRPQTAAQVRLGDARDGRTLRTAARWGSRPAFVVTSPPYPTEHDYTRNSRLELVFMEAVVDGDSLRAIKKKMIRSHSKGIYVRDRDAQMVGKFEPVGEIRRQIEELVHENASGFEGQYTKVVSNYFGGMLRHFAAMSKYLPTGSKLAYVVGDEASYKGVHIATARLLAEIIETYVRGLKLDSVDLWRTRRGYKNRQPLGEHVMLITVK